MESESSSSLRMRTEECSQNLSVPELEKSRGIKVINKRNARNKVPLTWQEETLCILSITYPIILFVIYAYFFGDFEQKGSLRAEDHLTCQSGAKLDIDKLVERKNLFSFFQKHDTDGDKRLDDKELLLGMLRLYQDTLKKHNESDNLLSDCELSWIGDFILKSDPMNRNGSIYYTALQPKEKKARSVSFSSSKKKWWSPKPAKSPVKSPKSPVNSPKSPKSPVNSPKSPKSPVSSPKSPASSPKSPDKSAKKRSSIR